MIFGLPSFFLVPGTTSRDNLNAPPSCHRPHIGLIMNSSDPTGDDWPMDRGSLDHDGFAAVAIPTAGPGSFWNCTIDGADPNSLSVSNGYVFLDDPQGEVYSLNASTGNRLWKSTLSGEAVGVPAIAGGCVYVGNGLGGYIGFSENCLSAATGTPLWNFTTGGPCTSSAIADGRDYVGCADDNVYCLDAATGASLWNYTTGYSVESPPAVVDGLVYIRSDDDNMYCLNAATGTLVWNYTTGGGVYTSPSVAGGCVFVGSSDNNFYCLNATTGTFLWKYAIGDWVTSPAIADGCVYLGCLDHKIYCLDARTGALVWNYVIGKDPSEPAVANGFVYDGAFVYQQEVDWMFCLDAATGVLVWNYTYAAGSPAIAYGCVYTVGDHQQVYCLPMELPPTAPQTLQITGGSGQVTLAWEPPASNGGTTVTSYKIYRGLTSGNETYLATISGACNYTDTNVTNNQTYYYTVSAVSLAGEGPQSSEGSFAIPPPFPLLAIYLIPVSIAGVVVIIVIVNRWRYKKKSMQPNEKSIEEL